MIQAGCSVQQWADALGSAHFWAGLEGPVRFLRWLPPPPALPLPPLARLLMGPAGGLGKTAVGGGFGGVVVKPL